MRIVTLESRPDPDTATRVLHFISNSYPSGYFRLIVQHTNHRRFRIEVGSLDRSNGLQEGLRELRIPTFALGAEHRRQYPYAALRLAARLRRQRIDVLHTHLFDAAWVGLTAARLAGTPLTIFTGHHSHAIPLERRRVLLELDRFAARGLADVVISPSQQMAETFVNVYGCRPDSVEVIEHGIDLGRFDPARVDGDAARRELGLEGKLVFGAISKHYWVKNLHALVRAFSVIAECHRNAHLVIIGLGDSASLAQVVDALGLGSRVSLLPSRRDVERVLAAFDVFVHPALAESFGLVVVEAMAMALPVLATPVGIARDVIEDDVSGIRIAGTNADAVQAAMTRALRCRDRWPGLGLEARRRALAFTPERWVSAHERLYERRLADGRSGATGMREA